MATGGPTAAAETSTRAGLGTRARDALAFVGPGLLFAIASMGSSHFLMAPTAGAAFGYALAWTILLAHLVKYPAFEYAARYTVATGENLLEGFAKLPGGRGVWLGAFTLLAGAQSVTIVAGVTAVTAAVALAAFPSLSLPLTIVAISAVAGLLLWFGAYRALERVSIAILAVVALLTIAAAAIARPDFGALVEGALTPLAPAGAALVVGGLLGYMPAPLELAVIESLWVAEKGVPAGTIARRERMRTALLDFRVGYVASVILGLLLLALGAALLAPAGVVPQGTGVFRAIAGIYERTLGGAAVPVYLAGAFLGMFATSYAVLDGFPRGISAALTALGRKPVRTGSGRDARYWLLLYATFLAGLAVVLLVPDPAKLVNLAAAGTVLVGPLWYALIVVVTHRLPEPFRPSLASRVAAWMGLAGMIGVAVFVASILFF